MINIKKYLKLFSIIISFLFFHNELSSLETLGGLPAVNVENNGKFNYLMGFDQSKEEDLRLKINDIDLIISPECMTNLKNCKLDYVEIEKNNFQFIFLNPNDPNFNPPDEDLDTNVTHDL